MLNLRELVLPVEHPAGSCRLCGCTDEHACDGGCFWIAEGLCSACVGLVLWLIRWPNGHYTHSIIAINHAINGESNVNVLTAALALLPGSSYVLHGELILTRIAELKASS